jgi:hypothetical protein
MRLLIWLAACLVVLNAGAGGTAAQTAIGRVYADTGNQVHVVTANGREFVVPRDLNQAGVDGIKISDDRRVAGWLVLYRQPYTGSPIAGKLAIWRDGHVVRTFKTPQTFWSWSFASSGQIAYHTGPTHGEQNSHCELHDVKTGRTLARWEGDLSDPNRPAWTKTLDH